MCVYAWVPRPRCRCRIPTPRRLAGGISSARALRWESGPGDGRAEAGAVGARLGVRPAARPGFYPCGRDHGRLCDPTAVLQGPSGCCREWPGAQGSGRVSEAMLFMSNRASRQVKGPRICERGSFRSSSASSSFARCGGGAWLGFSPRRGAQETRRDAGRRVSSS